MMMLLYVASISYYAVQYDDETGCYDYQHAIVLYGGLYWIAA